MIVSFHPVARSFPLDGGRGLGADVVRHPVDPSDLVDDPIRDPAQDLVGHVIPVRGHVVRRLHAADRAHLLVRSEGRTKTTTRDRIQSGGLCNAGGYTPAVFGADAILGSSGREVTRCCKRRRDKTSSM